MVIIEKCKEEMKNKSMTRKQLAELSGVPLPTINSIFNGTVQDPRYVTMTQICKAIGVSVDGTVGIISPDMGQEEINRVNKEHEETKEQLRKSIIKHDEYIKNRQEVMELKDKEIAVMENRNADLIKRIDSQVVVINIFRVWILALHIYGLMMDSLDTSTGLIRFPLLDIMKENGWSVTGIIAIAVLVYLAIFWITKNIGKNHSK